MRRKKILFILGADPRKSPRPAEAIRMAAGIAASDRIDLLLCLRDAAVLILEEGSDDFLDEDHYTRYRPLLQESAQSILVLQGSPYLKGIDAPAWSFQEIDPNRLAELAAESDFVANY